MRNSSPRKFNGANWAHMEYKWLTEAQVSWVVCFPFKKILMITVICACHLFEIINLIELFIIKMAPHKFPDKYIWNLSLCLLAFLKKKNILMIIKWSPSSFAMTLHHLVLSLISLLMLSLLTFCSLL